MIEWTPQLIWTVAIAAIVIMVIIYFKKEGSGSSKPMLGLYAKDLTALAAAGKLDPVIGRQEEISRVIQVLGRRSKNNPVLIGKAGVGKTAIIEGLAERIATGKVPQELIGKRVLALDISELVSGTKYRGEFEQRVKQLMNEITAANRQLILFVDEIHLLISAGGAEGGIKAEDIFKPALARGDLQMIGATTLGEYDEFIKKDVTLERRFQPVDVSEPDLKMTKQIAYGVREKYEKFHQVKITDAAIDEAIKLSNKYLKDRSFPDKTLDLIDEACSKVKLDTIGEEKTGHIPQVKPKDIEAIVKYYKKTS